MAPVSPALATVVTLEPPDLDQSLKIIQDTFQATSAVYLEDLKNFKPIARETLLKLADRFDEVALPLLTAGLMTSRGLALTLRRHLPIHIRKATLSAMLREDKKRTREGNPLLNKDELIKLAQAEEGFVLEFEAEMRAAGQIEPDARPIEDVPKLHDTKPPRARSPERKPATLLQDRLGPLNKDARDKSGPGGDKRPDVRLCHNCNKPGHLARFFTAKPTSTPPAPPTKKAEDFGQHKTEGHTCESCGKLGHTQEQC